MRQLEKERLRAQQASMEREEKLKVHTYRLEEAQKRMAKIEEEEKERCSKTAEILKMFEQSSANGPFFNSLLEILTNFQGIIINFYGPHLIETKW